MASPNQSLIPNQDPLAKLKEGAEAWNEWRSANPQIRPDLSAENLEHLDIHEADLSYVDFTGTNLSFANLSDCNLKRTNLTGTLLQEADLSLTIIEDAKITKETNLSNANLVAAILVNVNLRGLDLSWAKFEDASLEHCDLTEANLDHTTFSNAELINAKLDRCTALEADFSDATFENVTFDGADLAGANLADSSLQHADLSIVKNVFFPHQFAGAKLTGAKLPEPISRFHDRLGMVSEISDSAKKLFLALLAACLYSWLTIGTTKDVDLITNRASSQLPIIQTAIPMVGFYVVAPIILLCIYFYLHFYLQKLWEEIAHLPALFTDGKPLHQRADPWLFNDLVRAHSSNLRYDRPFLSYFQQLVSIVLAWWLVPLTLLFFWGRYVRRHDHFWTYILAIMTVLSWVAAARLYALARATLRGKKRLVALESLFHRQIYLTIVMTLALLAAFVAATHAVLNGTPETSIVRLMDRLGYSPFADLSNTDVSSKPPNWTGKKDDEPSLINGAKLRNLDLRFIHAERAFLVRADMTDSDLHAANLRFADLRQAFLTSSIRQKSFSFIGDLTGRRPSQVTHLDDADLSFSQLSGADLSFASMVRVRLFDADLSKATLASADLTDAQLGGADLTGADFQFADLTGAKFTGEDPLSGITEITPSAPASGLFPDVRIFFVGRHITKLKYTNLQSTKGLSAEQIKLCEDWQTAFYNDYLLQQLGLPPDHNLALEDYRKSGSQEPFDDVWLQKWRKKNPKAMGFYELLTKQHKDE